VTYTEGKSKRENERESQAESKRESERESERERAREGGLNFRLQEHAINTHTHEHRILKVSGAYADKVTGLE